MLFATSLSATGNAPSQNAKNPNVSLSVKIQVVNPNKKLLVANASRDSWEPLLYTSLKRLNLTLVVVVVIKANDLNDSIFLSNLIF